MRPPDSELALRVWDPFVRVFHWSLVSCVILNFFVVDDGETLHQFVGYTASGLVVARLVWGFVGSEYARFANFFPTPVRLRAHLAAMRTGRRDFQPGHNPLGALMMLALMALVLALGGGWWWLRDGDGGLQAIVGAWSAEVAYPWNLTLREHYVFTLEDGRIGGSASFLGVPRALEAVGMTEDMAKEMYRYLAIANYEDRFVIPTSKEEMRLEDYHGFQGQAGFSFGSASSVGISPNSLFPERRKESMEPRKPVPHADELHDVTGERFDLAEGDLCRYDISKGYLRERLDELLRPQLVDMPLTVDEEEPYVLGNYRMGDQRIPVALVYRARNMRQLLDSE